MAAPSNVSRQAGESQWCHRSFPGCSSIHPRRICFNGNEVGDCAVTVTPSWTRHAPHPRKKICYFQKYKQAYHLTYPSIRPSQQGNEHAAFCSLCSCVVWKSVQPMVVSMTQWHLDFHIGFHNDIHISFYTGVLTFTLTWLVTVTFSTQCIACSVCLKLSTLLVGSV